MNYLKYALLCINVGLSFILLQLDSGLALVTMAAALFMFLDLFFTSDMEPPAKDDKELK